MDLEHDRFRLWVVTHMPMIAFLFSYSFLVVLGNLMFVSRFGREMLHGYPIDFFAFEETFTPGYWLLLLSPYLVAPLAYTIGRRVFLRRVAIFTDWVPEIGVFGCAIAMCILIAFVLHATIAADALNLSRSATDDIASVEARFEILGRLGFAILAVLQSLLTFMSFVILVSALRTGRVAWFLLSTIAVAVTTAGLVALNMKWPVVVFYMGITIAVFSYQKKWVYVSTSFCMIALLCVYFLISTFVFRISSADQGPGLAVERAVPNGVERKASSGAEPNTSSGDEAGTPKIILSAIRFAPLFLRAAIIRLAIGYPYYYHVFTSEGPVCGGVLTQMQRGPACRPSKVIYSRLFPNDRFQNRGTSGSSVHISAYALGGWPLAMTALIAASFVMAFISCLPLNGNATVGALRVVGALAGYHFSQLPGEGIFLYDHGLLWVLVLILAFKLFSFFGFHSLSPGPT